MLRLIQQHTEFLLSEKESGMGYQCLEDGSSQKYLVLNAELFVSSDELKNLLKFPSYEDLLDEIKDTSKNININGYKVISASEFLKSTFSSDKLQNPSLLQTQSTRDNEGFKRFSAYKDDKRKTPGRGLRKETYATTVNDINVVPSGLSAVARYALPNPWPAIYVLTITPPKDTKIRCGTVQPAFNQSGGGVEIFFEDETPDNTVSGPYVIPER